MKIRMRMLATCVAFAAASVIASGALAADTNADLIQSAMAAGPTSVSSKARVVLPQLDGSLKVLREGSNNWTCIPPNPGNPGPGAICMDHNAIGWAQAYLTHKMPPAGTVGVMYKLTGGTEPSITDPYATKPAPGKDWTRIGPHMIIVGSAEILKGYPQEASPDTTVPFVLWGGTPYQQLVIPVARAPK